MNKVKKEILFKNETTCTQKEYKEFLNVQKKEYALLEFLYTFGYTIFFIIFGFVLIGYKDIMTGIIIILFGILFFIYRNWYPNSLKKKQKRKLKKPLKNTYIFYKNYFITENKMGNSNIFYLRIHRVIETKDVFYIYLNREGAFIVSKMGFIQGQEKDFAEFLRKKVRFKYKVRNN